MKTTLELQTILMAGGSIVISATRHTVLDLQTLAMAAQNSGSRITLKDANRLTVLEISTLARAGGGRGTVEFDLST